ELEIARCTVRNATVDHRVRLRLACGVRGSYVESFGLDADALRQRILCAKTGDKAPVGLVQVYGLSGEAWENVCDAMTSIEPSDAARHVEERLIDYDAGAGAQSCEGP